MMYQVEIKDKIYTIQSTFPRIASQKALFKYAQKHKVKKGCIVKCFIGQKVYKLKTKRFN